ncbi:composite domain of metallo-dependent hydrolase [Cylindrobasidium torrendii FP15055 ss-10]|uniref:Composite domain of metallo-dependent hydrolase n=1 Tax=Cylindrobasidium torrendii FP15055 ss-10 TaxID=1314674 RepID=A0A0D7B8R2_9AGAR|nr:composite domain of metallo-dependent hydrolase [Cylindrobasidium torrendii FP15055 ss-10]
MSSEKVAWNPPSIRPPRPLFLALLVAASTISLLSINLPRGEIDASLAAAEPEWEDNTWPYRNQTPWDIEKDFEYPRKLEFDVEEGTWLRLDVHPHTGEVVFDMLGDLYCLPKSTPDSLEPLIAQPLLIGIPFDADPSFSPDGTKLAFRSDAGLGVQNIWVLPWRGCGRADRKEARRITNETWRWLSAPSWHPTGSRIIASKWYQGRVTLAASEGWEYDASTLSAGQKLLGRTLPVGKTVENYGDMQIGPEQFIWRTEETLIYSKNVADDFFIGEDHDVHRGVYAIFSRNMTSGKETRIVDAFPGGASCPQLSRDKRTLAFVRRVRDNEVLALLDLETGTLRHIWDGLTYDLSLQWAPMGTYPSFAFTAYDDAIIIWAAGKIWNVPLTTNKDGERLRGAEPTPIRFRAHVEMQLAETIKGGIDLVGLETADTQAVNAFRDLDINASGDLAVVQAAAVTVVHDLKKGNTTPVPVLHPASPYYSPAFVDGSNELIVHIRWSDSDFSKLELADLSSGTAYAFESLPLGRYLKPAISPGRTHVRKLAYIKTGGDSLTGNVVATAQPGLYVANIVLPGNSSAPVTVTDIQFVHDINPGLADNLRLRWLDDNRLMVLHELKAHIVDLADNNAQHLVVSGELSTEIAIAAVDEPEWVAFVEYQHLFITPMNAVNGQLWAKPGKATSGIVRLSEFGAHHATWTRNGKKLFWLSGRTLYSLEVARLKECAIDIRQDRVNFGVGCVKGLVEETDIEVEHSTDIARLKKEAKGSSLVIRNATILTMQTGIIDQDVLERATLVVKDGLIQAVGLDMDIKVPANSEVIDAEGVFVVPGFIDMHAHWASQSLSPFPAKSWPMQVFLAYGVTTMHNPSAPTVATFAERSKLESGQFIGPRIFTAGSPVFAGTWRGLHEEIVDMDEARAALMRIKKEGGHATLSYKNYQLPSRASRQRLLRTAKELGMICVPEGGGYFDWDLTYIIDGMTTVEHSMPPAIYYDDVLTLFAQSGTGLTPTHLVSYGGPFGEEHIWANHDVPNDPKLRRFSMHSDLEGLHETWSRPDSSYVMFNTSKTVAKLVERGLKAHIGAHGEAPLGHNYHAEMAFAKLGGISNYEVLKMATSAPAQTLGLWTSIGSLAPGKLADFLVYPAGVDLLEGAIERTRDLKYVARGGRMWDADTMAQLWPLKKPPQEMPPINVT